MSVPILDASAWREFRGKPGNAGLNETTHLARIADASGKIHDCFVKLLPLDGAALLCEAIGWLLARKSDVSCPAFAAIVLVPVDKLRKCGPLPSKFDGMALCPAWCSEIVAGKVVRQIHKMFYFTARKNCLRSKDARKIAAFDQWGDLRDRNFGNVIQSSKGGYVAIDHESILHDLLWAPTGRGFEERSLMVEARKALSTADYQRFQVDMAHAANGHAQALVDAKADLADIISKLIPEHAPAATQAIVQMLDQRGQSGWLSNNLGVIA
ncbi:hypothetical protein [Massilia psychrophila]|uniref:HipA-like C-terminal domain-containing protein n=1 Tax=Massilia psychrophila TaxID=1603353 RepID=A0A2G8SZI2_9BURK|nr:hypothetical protein [Massilia psychrophila]PIL39215.1 hypothetical protein CR103_14105 [Massilia psychrophila]GGE81943.1 hypothetical protein GCM10008020_28580 [Massilia psychrophila]